MLLPYLLLNTPCLLLFIIFFGSSYNLLLSIFYFSIFSIFYINNIFCEKSINLVCLLKILLSSSVICWCVFWSNLFIEYHFNLFKNNNLLILFCLIFLNLFINTCFSKLIFKKFKFY